MNEQIEILYKTIEAKDKIIDEQVLEIARLKDDIRDWEEENTRIFDILDETRQDLFVADGRIDKAIEYNKNILKEKWYGGNEKKYAKTNLEILGEKDE